MKISNHNSSKFAPPTKIFKFWSQTWTSLGFFVYVPLITIPYLTYMVNSLEKKQSRLVKFCIIKTIFSLAKKKDWKCNWAKIGHFFATKDINFFWFYRKRVRKLYPFFNCTLKQARCLAILEVDNQFEKYLFELRNKFDKGRNDQ